MFRVPTIPASANDNINLDNNNNDNSPIIKKFAIVGRPQNSLGLATEIKSMPDYEEDKENRPVPTSMKQQHSLYSHDNHSTVASSKQKSHKMFLAANQSFGRGSRSLKPKKPLSEISVHHLSDNTSLILNLIATSVTKESITQLGARWFEPEEISEIIENWDQIRAALISVKDSFVAAADAATPDAESSKKAKSDVAATDLEGVFEQRKNSISLYDLVINYQGLKFAEYAKAMASSAAVSKIHDFDIYCDEDSSADNLQESNELRQISTVLSRSPLRRSSRQHRTQQMDPGMISPPSGSFQSEEQPVQLNIEDGNLQRTGRKQAEESITESRTDDGLLLSPRRSKRKRGAHMAVSELETLVENGMSIFSPPRITRSASKLSDISSNSTPSSNQVMLDRTKSSEGKTRAQTRSAKKLFPPSKQK